MGRPRRIFFGLKEIAGYYGRLRIGLGEIGVPSRQLNLRPHWFGAASDGSGIGAGVVRRLFAREFAAGGAMRWIWKAARLLVETPVRCTQLFWACLTCDVFVFGYFSTFFGFWELPLLRLLGKRIVFIFHGSDSRPAYMDGNYVLHCTPAALANLARRQKRAMRCVERWATLCVNHPPSAQFHERPFVQWLWLGLPTQAPDCNPAAERAPGPVRIVHAPSARDVKGSAEIRAIVERLQAGGAEVEFIELHGVPNHEVWKALQRADFVVDQMLADTPLAGFAAEAASVGRPAVIGSYAVDEVARLVGPELTPPSAFHAPAEMGAAVARLTEDASFRRELGMRAAEFVRTEWTPRAVAERFVQMLEVPDGGVPMCDPAQIRYATGSGATRDRVAAAVRSVVDAHGASALQVDDKPALRDALLALARG